MAGDGPLDRLREVAPQVPAVGHLHHVRRARAGAGCIGAGAVSVDDLDARVLRQPVAEGLSLPIGNFNDYWRFHLSREQQRVHLARYANNALPKAA